MLKFVLKKEGKDHLYMSFLLRPQSISGRIPKKRTGHRLPLVRTMGG